MTAPGNLDNAAFIPVTAQDTGMTYRGSGRAQAFIFGGFNRSSNPDTAYRFTLSYVTGSHAIKVGWNDQQGHLDHQLYTLQPLQYPGGIYLDRVLPPKQVSIEPPVLIGRGAIIGAKSALLGGVVIGRQVTIGKGCSLRSTLVWDGARVGEGSSLSECIVTSGVSIPAGVSLTNKIFLRPEGYQGKKQKMERLGQCWMISL